VFPYFQARPESPRSTKKSRLRWYSRAPVSRATAAILAGGSGSAQIAGRVVELRFDVGDAVKKGEVIVRIDERAASQAVAASTAQVQEAQAALANAKARMELLGGMRESAQSGLGAIMKAAPLLLAHGGEVTREGVRQPDRDRYARALAGRLPVDDERRDTVPAMLSPGEVVVPRSVAQAPDAPERAARFLAALRAQRRSAA